MHIAMLSPIAWRTPPRHYGPWENVASLITEGLVACGHEVTLFATADSQTSGTLHAICPQGYEEDRSMIPKVWECLHISELFEHADVYDIIHNNFDYLPLTYTGLTTTPVVTTIHGFSSPGILPVYIKYNQKVNNLDEKAKAYEKKRKKHQTQVEAYNNRVRQINAELDKKRSEP